MIPATIPAVVAATPTVDLCVGPIGALCGASSVGGVGLGIGQVAMDMAMRGFGEMFVSGAAEASAGMLAALDDSTRVDLSVAWFRNNTAVLAAITVPIVVGLFALQVIGSVLRREPGGLVRAIVGVGKAFLGSAIALAATQAALVACDEIAAAIAAAAGTSVTDAASRFMSLTHLSGSLVGIVLQILLSFAVIVASFLLWTVLLFRKAALLVVAVFAPVAFAGAAWDHTRGWVRRWIELVAALVFCKIVIVVVFIVGASAFGGAAGSGASKGSALSDMLAGLLLLGIAAFSPWLTWRFVHWSGAEINEAVHGTVASSPVPAAARSGARTTSRMVKVAAFSAAGQPLVGAAAGAHARPPSRAPRAPSPPGPVPPARAQGRAASNPRGDTR